MWLPPSSTIFPHQYWGVWGCTTKDEDSRTETSFAPGEGRMSRETYLFSLNECWNGTRVIINPPLLHSFFLVSIKTSDSLSQFPMPYSLGNAAALLTCYLKDTITASHLTSILSCLSWSSPVLFRKSVRSGLRVFYFSTLQDLRTPRKDLGNWCLTDRVLPQSSVI